MVKPKSSRKELHGPLGPTWCRHLRFGDAGLLSPIPGSCNELRHTEPVSHSSHNCYS